ncbi:MAG: butyryl-CoA dehydrogenase [Chloroflexi bacterium]|nr:MAG: butyryl-CoA dehydrogenase [Chloroflexota bacterium]
MRFDLNADEETLRDAVREFLAREVAGRIAAWETEGHCPVELGAHMGRNGLLGIGIPMQFGGSGMGYSALAVLCEELEYVDSALRILVSGHSVQVAQTLLRWGSADHQQRWLPELAMGRVFGGFVDTSRCAPVDGSVQRMTATKSARGYLLSGVAAAVPFVEHVGLWLLLVDVRDGSGGGHVPLLVTRDAPGLAVEVETDVRGLRCAGIGRLVAENVFVPAEQVLGNPQDVTLVAAFCRERGRFSYAAGCTGLARAALDASVAYCHARTAFGQTIGKFELIQQKLAAMVAGIDATRLLTLHASDLLDAGRDAGRVTALAALRGGEVAQRAADDAVQIHGAYGYSNEFPAERLMRNARAAAGLAGPVLPDQIAVAAAALAASADEADIPR